jgi:CRP/FNR family transcriptional regulator, cyclic AMP receptor protein
MSNGALSLDRFFSKSGQGGALQHIPRSSRLFAQGKQGQSVFYVMAGVVGLTVALNGKERIVSLLGPGSFAGKECIAADQPRSTSSGRTLTDCTVLRIERKEFLRVLRDEKTFGPLFRDYLLTRITRYQEVIMEQLSDSAEERLAQMLLQLANFENGDKGWAVVPNISQNDMAEVVGTTRSRVSYFMNHFRVLELIAYKGSGPVTIRATKLSSWLARQHSSVSSLKAKQVEAR